MTLTLTIADEKDLNISSPAFVCALADALGLLSLLPPPAQREQAQGETPYHPPSRGQPEAYAAVIALYVQVSRFFKFNLSLF